MNPFATLTSFIAFALLWSSVCFGADLQHLEWAYELDNPPAFYLDQGIPEPERADDVTAAVPNASYVVKLPCWGCPFSVRTWLGYNDTLEIENPTENVLLFNLSLSDDSPTLGLNYHDIFPADLPSMRDLTATQAPVWLFKDTLQKMIEEEIFDRPFQGVGTAYDSFSFSYSLTTITNKQATPPGWTLILDIASVDYTIPHTQDNRIHQLSDTMQPVIQIVINQVSNDVQLPDSERIRDRYISDIRLISREMSHELISNSGSRAEVTEYRGNDWDRYGHKGTLSHDWSKLLWDLDYIVASTFPLWAIAIVASAVWYCTRRRRRSIAAKMASERWKHIY